MSTRMLLQNPSATVYAHKQRYQGDWRDIMTHLHNRRNRHSRAVAAPTAKSIATHTTNASDDNDTLDEYTRVWQRRIDTYRATLQRNRMRKSRRHRGGGGGGGDDDDKKNRRETRPTRRTTPRWVAGFIRNQPLLAHEREMRMQRSVHLIAHQSTVRVYTHDELEAYKHNFESMITLLPQRLAQIVPQNMLVTYLRDRRNVAGNCAYPLAQRLWAMFHLEQPPAVTTSSSSSSTVPTSTASPPSIVPAAAATAASGSEPRKRGGIVPKLDIHRLLIAGCNPSAFRRKASESARYIPASSVNRRREDRATAAWASRLHHMHNGFTTDADSDGKDECDPLRAAYTVIPGMHFHDYLVLVGVVVHGTPEDRANMAFEFYDTDGDGIITTHDIFAIVRSQLDELVPRDIAFIARALREHNGGMNRAKFMRSWLERAHSSDIIQRIDTIFKASQISRHY